ncbi:MAG TPA: hypothetical protein GX723_05675, partial [Thermoanaerobacterales bacterium]|nr:hypothetical protein [Thermoanaerobacterales bacterium]
LYASGSYSNAVVNDKAGILFENTNQSSPDYGAMYIGPGIFAIASEKNADNSWNWKTFGTGQGFYGSELVAESVTANKLASDVGQQLDISSNVAITLAIDNVDIGAVNLISHSRFSQNYPDFIGWQKSSAHFSLSHVGSEEDPDGVMCIEFYTLSASTPGVISYTNLDYNSMVDGEEYTLTIKTFANGGYTHPPVCVCIGGQYIDAFSQEGISQKTFVLNKTQIGSNPYIFIYTNRDYLEGQTGRKFYVHYITLIRGNKAPKEHIPSNLEKRMLDAEIKITDTAIVSTVRNSTPYQNDLAGKQPVGNYSTVEQTASSIVAAVNDIDVGGRNYVLNSDWSQGALVRWSKNANLAGLYFEQNESYKIDNKQAFILACNPNTEGIMSQYIDIKCVEDSSMILSFFLRTNGTNLTRYNSQNPLIATLEGIDNNSTLLFWKGIYFYTEYRTDLQNGFYKFVFPFTCPAGLTQLRLYLRISSNSADYENSAGYQMIQIEKGTKVTPWKPAVEDPSSGLKSSHIT